MSACPDLPSRPRRELLAAKAARLWPAPAGPPRSRQTTAAPAAILRSYFALLVRPDRPAGVDHTPGESSHRIEQPGEIERRAPIGKARDDLRQNDRTEDAADLPGGVHHAANQ